jgi:hypothetical protein
MAISQFYDVLTTRNTKNIASDNKPANPINGYGLAVFGNSCGAGSGVGAGSGAGAGAAASG